MTGVRSPVAAGTFYPGDPDALAATVDALLDGARVSGRVTRPAALIVPHAGYVYSGPVAATGYARLVPWGESVHRVAVLGPAHFVALEGLALPTVSALDSPLGRVLADTDGGRVLVDKGLAVLSDAPHAIEHSLEVQLPFLQRILGEDWTCAALAVGRSEPELVADALDQLDADLVVVSTDLSHYEPQATAQLQDRRTAEAVVQRRPDQIGRLDACGARPLRGLLAWALRHDHHVELLDLRTSADTVGGPERVVGYGAFVVT